jgi:hypothetical protein
VVQENHVAGNILKRDLEIGVEHPESTSGGDATTTQSSVVGQSCFGESKSLPACREVVHNPMNLVTTAGEVHSEEITKVPVNAGYQDVRVSTRWL